MVMLPALSLRVASPAPAVMEPAPPAKTMSVSAASEIVPAEPPLVMEPAVLVRVPVPAERLMPFASPVMVLELVSPTPVRAKEPPDAEMFPLVVTAPPAMMLRAPEVVEVAPMATPSVSAK